MRADRTLRTLASIVLLAGLGLGVWSVARAPESAPAWTPPAGPGSRPEPFHRYDRALLEPPPGPAYCTGCHPLRAHGRDPMVRAFLNLHSDAMDCGVCHWRGRTLRVRRFGGRLYAAVRGREGWDPVVRPREGVEWVLRPGRCRSCHRRGSPILAARGLFDPYRRRLLEDLAVLRWLEGGP